MKLEFSGQIFEKYLNIRFNENPSSGIQLVPCGWTERLDEAYSRFSQFCERYSNLNVQHLKQAICGELLAVSTEECANFLSKIVIIL